MKKPQMIEGPKFILGEEIPEGLYLRAGFGEFSVAAQAAPERPGQSEDSAAIIPVRPDTGVLVIADGVGGHRDGSQASQLAVKKVAESLKKVPEDQVELREAILDGFEKANQAILNLGSGAATTLSVVRIRKKTIRVYHVGDSLVLLVGQRGKVKFQAVFHSPVGYALASGMMNEKEAIHHEERHLVSNIIGTPDMSIEIGSEISLSDRDTLLLATDGISDNLVSQEMVERIRKGPLIKCSRALAQLTQQRMKQPTEGKPSKPDDMTFLLFRLGR